MICQEVSGEILKNFKWENFWKNFKLCEDIFMMNRGEKFLKIDIKFS